MPQNAMVVDHTSLLKDQTLPKQLATTAILDAMPDCLLRVSRSGIVQGYKLDRQYPLLSAAKDILGQSVSSVFPPDLVWSVHEAITAALDNGNLQQLEFSCINKNKSMYYEARFAKVDDEDVLIIIREISERRRAEECEVSLLDIAGMVQEERPIGEILSWACERIKTIFSVRLLWVGRKDPGTAVTLYTCGGEHENFLPDFNIRWSESMEGNGLTGTAIRTGKFQLMDIEDPRLLPWREQLEKFGVVTGAAFPLKVGGEVLGALTVFSCDIDFWKKRTVIHLTNFAEQIAFALRVTANRQRLNLLTTGLESAANATVIADRKGNIQWVNPAFLALNGYSRTDALNSNIRMLKSKQHAQSFYRSLWKIITIGRIWRGEVIICKKDGSEYTAEVTITPVRDESGKISNFLAIIQDVTERKQVESERLEAREIVTRAERLSALGIMAAGIAHEINQPLNSLKVMADGMLYWYKQGRIPEISEAMQTIQDVSQEADRIDAIIKHMRAFIQGNEFTKPVPCDLNTAVDEALSFIGAQMMSHGVEVITDLASGMPAILGSSIQLEQIIINLMVNAMQSLDKETKPDKHITVKTGYTKDTVFLVVSDNGPGISKEIRNKIFDPFFTTKAAGEGMGLGLSIVHSIVTSYGGQIRLENDKAAEGAAFRVEFPIAQDRQKGEILL